MRHVGSQQVAYTFSLSFINVFYAIWGVFQSNSSLLIATLKIRVSFCAQYTFPTSYLSLIANFLLYVPPFPLHTCSSSLPSSSTYTLFHFIRVPPHYLPPPLHTPFFTSYLSPLTTFLLLYIQLFSIHTCPSLLPSSSSTYTLSHFIPVSHH